MQREIYNGECVETTKLMTSQTIFSLFESKKLIPSPKYQRNFVWPPSWKPQLIDTILRGWPVPDMYFRVHPDTGIYEIVNGQQRSLTVASFIRNEFTVGNLDKDGIPRFYTFNTMSREMQDQFLNYKFVIRELVGSDETIHLIFKRINANTLILKPQEMRHAIYQGEFLSLVEDLSDFYWQKNGIITQVQAGRMDDAYFVSDLLTSIMDDLCDSPYSSYQTVEFYRKYRKSFPERQRIRERFLNIRDRVDLLVPQISYTKWRKRSNYYMLFNAIWLLTKSKKFPINEEHQKKARLALAVFLDKLSKGVDSSDPLIRKFYETTMTGVRERTTAKINAINILKAYILDAINLPA